jgi:hypothetical protein
MLIFDHAEHMASQEHHEVVQAQQVDEGVMGASSDSIAPMLVHSPHILSICLCLPLFAFVFHCFQLPLFALIWLGGGYPS